MLFDEDGVPKLNLFEEVEEEDVVKELFKKHYNKSNVEENYKLHALDIPSATGIDDVTGVRGLIHNRSGASTPHKDDGKTNSYLPGMSTIRGGFRDHWSNNISGGNSPLPPLEKADLVPDKRSQTKFGVVGSPVISSTPVIGTKSGKSPVSTEEVRTLNICVSMY